MNFKKLDELLDSDEVTEKQKYQINRVKDYFIKNGKNGRLKYQCTMINVLKMVDAGVNNAFIERLKRSIEIGAKATLKKMVIIYGKEIGKEKWKAYCDKQAEVNTFEYKRVKHGWTEEQFKEYNKSRSVTLSNLIERHGKEIGYEMWTSYKEKQKDAGCSLEYFKKKYGKEEGEIFYKNLNWRKCHTLDVYIWRHGKEEGLKLYEKFWENFSTSFLFSKVSQRFFWLLYSKIPEEKRRHCYFGELNKEFGTFHNNRYYFYDFVLTDRKICIEFNGDYWHANPLIYRPDEEIKYPNNIVRKAKDIWDKDKDKIDILVNKGYNVYIVWERSYTLNELKEVERIANIING